MPWKQVGPCRYGRGRCPKLGTVRGFCDDHAKQVERDRGTAAERGYDAAWRVRSRAFLAAHKWCKLCGKRAKHADHFPVSVKEARRLGWPRERMDADDNLRPLCHSCHSKYTAVHQSGWGAAPGAAGAPPGGPADLPGGRLDPVTPRPEMEAARRPACARSSSSGGSERVPDDDGEIAV
jgi:5-methylcytosine-specific restriction protein A